MALVTPASSVPGLIGSFLKVLCKKFCLIFFAISLEFKYFKATNTKLLSMILFLVYTAHKYIHWIIYALNCFSGAKKLAPKNSTWKTIKNPDCVKGIPLSHVELKLLDIYIIQFKYTSILCISKYPYIYIYLSIPGYKKLHS